MRALSDRLGRRVGGSTGTNLVACAKLIAEMDASGTKGSIVTILCDAGERYAHSYYDPAWYEARGIEVAAADAAIAAAVAGEPLPALACAGQEAFPYQA